MKFTQHFHGANLSNLLAEARQDAQEFRPLPSPAPLFHDRHSPMAERFLAQLGKQPGILEGIVTLLKGTAGAGQFLGWGTSPAGRPVPVMKRSRRFAQYAVGGAV